jgi:hypothetical protein
MTRRVEAFCDKIVSFNNLAKVVLNALVKPDLDTRLVEALPAVAFLFRRCGLPP